MIIILPFYYKEYKEDFILSTKCILVLYAIFIFFCPYCLE